MLLYLTIISNKTKVVTTLEKYYSLCRENLFGIYKIKTTSITISILQMLSHKLINYSMGLLFYKEADFCFYTQVLTTVDLTCTTSKISSHLCYFHVYIQLVSRHGSLTLVIEDLLFKGLKSLNFFVKF